MKSRSQYALLLAALFGPGGCGTQPAPVATGSSGAAAAGPLRLVAVERVYGDLASQIGGTAVTVTTILNSPSADPHAYEPSTGDANAVAAADIVIENGLGYDAFADKLTAASPKSGRTVINVGALGGHSVGDNPHVWYEASTLQRFLRGLTADLAMRDPKRRATFERQRDALLAWTAQFAARVRSVGAKHPGVRVAITEPVFDYVLHAAGLVIATPVSFSHAIEEGNDPAPQDVDAMRSLLASRSVAAFVYNRQTVEPSTERLLAVAQTAHVPVVPVTETLPAGETTQSWIDGEVAALDRAL
jgi:zinc/manganese transport system substrate-binding protein